MKFFPFSSNVRGSVYYQYEELLRHTGKMPIEELGATFLNQVLSKKAFWEKAIEQFISLTDKYVN